MLDAIKPLLDSDLINEETKTAIQEAWESKLEETREQVRAELREEFAHRYEHDKSTMVEALDRMVTENLTTEIEQIVEEKKALAEDRAKFVARMRETSGTFDKFLVKQLAEEIGELHGDRTKQASIVEKLEEFVVKQLAEEIHDFQEDRQDVVNTKVRLVKEARGQFGKLKKTFINRSSELVKEAVTKHLTNELTQLKEDIAAAKENNFGRRIFEAFSSEFSASYLNENQDIKKLEAQVSATGEALTQAEVVIAEKDQLIKSKEDEVDVIKESVERKEIITELLKPLNKEKGAIMRDLLESVQTSKVKNAFDRYLPAVLDGAAPKPIKGKKVINESRKGVTGNKEIKTQPVKRDDNIIELRKLAGLN